MKLYTVCVVAVLLWAGVDALAQGKGQGKGQQARIKDNAPKANQPQQNPGAAAETAARNAAKGNKGAKSQEGATPSESKQAADHGKKVEKLSDAVEKGKGKAGQQLQAMQKQLQHEQAKHRERYARLMRIRELAVQKDDTATVARVDKLIQKEQQVYDRKLQHLQGQKRATQPPAEVGKETAAPPAAPGAADEGKPAETPGSNAPGQSAGQPAQPGTGEGAPKN